MELAAHVLLIGDDEALLETRALVLRHFWQVSMGRGWLASGLIETLPTEADLVVLCHTFTEDERQKWVDAARALLPKLLIVRLSGFDAGPRAGTDATVGLSGGPGALVSAIYELLTERGLASRPWVSPKSALLDASVLH